MSKIEDKIDDAAYAEGRAAFDDGQSLMSVIHNAMTADLAGEDARMMCLLVGFADAALDKLRGIQR